MKLPPVTKTRKSSGWTPERRAKHAEAIRKWKPWEKSTGPKSAEGKKSAALNAYKHGHRGALSEELARTITAQFRFLQLHEGLKKQIKIQHERTIEARRNRARSMAKIRTARKTACAKSLQNPALGPITAPMWTVAALYRFVALSDLPALQAEIKAVCEANDICGTLLLAPEGINGTIGGVGEKLDAIINTLDRLCGVREGELKYSTSTGKPFLRMKVRLKKEIITMAAPEADPTKLVGTYVEAQDWNALIADPDVTLIDTRNDYETAVGIFKGAIDPDITKFTDFKDFVAEKLDPKKQKKIAMFCTGGIRCEKASSYMLAHGFEEVYHLKGGILKYLETIPADQSQWDGECFVFDRRVAVGHGLTEGEHDICYGCRFPLKDGDKQSAMYEEGVSCPRCHADLTPHKMESLRMRHSQFKKGEILQG